MGREIYAIGDIQGCYDEFKNLLKEIHFDKDKHKLWITGDLVNRGPKSLKTLRFVKKLNEAGAADIVLGNHDLHLIATTVGHRDLYPGDTIKKILKADDSDDLIEWLCHQPFIQSDNKTGFVMAHAGISPQWNIDQAHDYAAEVETVLKGKKRKKLLATMYGNQPDIWSDGLKGMARYRYIINAFTRMRFVDKKSAALDMKEKNKPGLQAAHLCPWFKSKLRNHNASIVFGHWAALDMSREQCKKNRVYHIDTGCVWGKHLTALNLQTLKLTKVRSKFKAG